MHRRGPIAPSDKFAGKIHHRTVEHCAGLIRRPQGASVIDFVREQGYLFGMAEANGFGGRFVR